jgi:hypothetical protein
MNFEWPPSDAYGRLTRNHYRVVSLTPLEPGFAQAVRGVHSWEPSALDARWRWLERAATLRVFPRGASAVALILGLPAVSEIESNQIRVVADGAEVASFEVARGEEMRIEIPVRHPGPLFIGFRAERSYVPRNSEDRRELALQLRAIERIGGQP